MYPINTMSFPMKVNSNTIELTVYTSCYCTLDLLCVSIIGKILHMFHMLEILPQQVLRKLKKKGKILG